MAKFSHLLVAAAATVLFHPALGAQSSMYIPSDTPNSGPCSSIPMGGKIKEPQFRSQRTMFVVTAAELGNRKRLISNMAFAPCGNGIREYGRIRIQFGYHKGPLGTTYDANFIGRPTSVLETIKHYWENVAGRWNNIGLERPFAYDPAGGDLLVDIVVSNADFSGAVTTMRSDARPTLYASGFSPWPKVGTLSNASTKIRFSDGVAFIDNHLQPCGRGPLVLDAKGSGKLGTSIDFKMTGGDPSPTLSVGVLLLGVDKALIGLGNDCSVYVNPFLILFMPIQSGVSPVVRLPIPNDSKLSGGKVYFQGANQDATVSRIGFALTQRVTVTLGR